MYHRQLALLAVLVGAVFLLAPVSAAGATTWRFRDQNGTVVGTVVLKTVGGKRLVEATPLAPTISLGGWAESRSWGALVQWYRMGYPYAKKVVPAGLRWKTQYFGGLLVRKGDRWYASRLINGQRKRVGSISHACPGKFALGAAMLIRFPIP